ncbi:cupin domain-containing protein [Rhodovarius crocodyli]|uniref:Cupin domain-containing protein n=1 Tax=Rhodovarius crocodyli TaxID=1979269 RepID=A0A437LXG4_9PROT|nr:cupin domain-containing protein [Rhodovarius crocodyli]RVT90080.1 cupin domain-containing protein [Rhodovarius crocodyli]
MPEELRLGGQIRELRKIKGLTLAEMAARLGVSIGHLSQIERDRSKLQIGTLKAISDILGVHINWFFQPQPDRPPEEVEFIVRAEGRRRMSFTGLGIQEELASPNLSGPLELLVSTIEPGADSGAYSHDGAEAGYVLAGTLALWIGERRFELHEGDSFAFPSTTPHRCANPGSVVCKVLWVVTPPSY